MQKLQEVKLLYAPSPGQLEFHLDRYVARERLLSCGTGGGKTFSLLFEVIDWCLENAGPGTVLYAMPTVPMFKKAVPKSWEMLTGQPLGGKGLGAEWNETDRRLRLPGGWEIWFVTVEDPLNIEGPPSVDLVVLDEARVVRKLAGPDGAWSQLLRRLRGQDESRRRGAIMASHSPTPAMLDLFKAKAVRRYEAPGVLGKGRFEVTDCIDPERRAYRWGTLDAVAWGTLSKKDGERIAAETKSYGQAAYDAIILGLQARSQGLLIDAYDPARHLKEPAPGQIWDDKSGGIDFGWTHPAALSVAGWRGSLCHFLETWEGSHLSTAKLADKMRELERRHGCEGMTWWADNAAPTQIKDLCELGLDVRGYKGPLEDSIRNFNSRLVGGETLIGPACQSLVADMDAATRIPGTDKPDKTIHDPHSLDASRYNIGGHLTGDGPKRLVGGIGW